MSMPARVPFVLGLGILGASQSGNLVRVGDAPAVAIATWRLVFAALCLLPFAGRRLGSVRVLARGDWLLLVVAGGALAFHFFTWIASVQTTTVANAAIFFSVNPVLTAAGGWLFFRERVTRRLALATALGLGGVVVIGAGDLQLSPEFLLGDSLSLLCSALFSVYFLLGRRFRQRLDIDVYATLLYGIAALFGFATLLCLDLPLLDYSPRSWLCFGLMALVPTIMGHTSLNYALRWVAASRISALTLAEPTLAGAVAWLVWDEPMSGQAIAGYALVSAGVSILVRDSWVPSAPDRTPKGS